MSFAIALLAVSAAAQPILHYVRSNRDGTEAEHVVQYRPDATRIAVYKWVERCTTAAYVTAELSPEKTEAREYVAGKVAEDGGQARFGTLRLEPSSPALEVDIRPPGGERIAMRHPLKARPYIIYDFDLADLNAVLQEHGPGDNFSFEMPVIWPGDPNLFRDLGRLNARFAGKESRLGRDTHRFDLTVDGPTPSTGKLWLDAERGFIVEAELGLPNHEGYRDFRLLLERVQPGGEAAWNALTQGHYAECPTGN